MIPDFIMDLVKQNSWCVNPEFDTKNRVDSLRAEALMAIKMYKEAKKRQLAREKRLKDVQDWIDANETKPDGKPE